jgi:hypothetical protein
VATFLIDHGLQAPNSKTAFSLQVEIDLFTFSMTICAGPEVGGGAIAATR